MTDYIADGIKVFDTVYDLSLGEGVVTTVDPTADLPIVVKFTYKNKVVRYNALGEVYEGANQTLYFSEPDITGGTTQDTNWANVSVGAAIEVSEDDITYVAAFFLAYYSTNVRPFSAADAIPSVATTSAFYAYARTV